MATWTNSFTSSGGSFMDGNFHAKVYVEGTDYNDKTSIRVYCYAVPRNSNIGSNFLYGKVTENSNGEYGKENENAVSLWKTGKEALVKKGKSFDISRAPQEKTFTCKAYLRGGGDPEWYGGDTDEASISVKIPALERYTITYNPNESTSAPLPDIKYYGIDKQITTDSPEVLTWHHDFNGWNTEPDGTGTAYASGANYTKNEDVVLYAQWILKTYNIYYYPNYNDTNPDIRSVTWGSDWTTKEAVARTGWRHIGWNTKADGSGTFYPVFASQGQYKLENDLTLYAQWVPATYQVSYNANGGNNVPNNQTKEYNISLTITSSIPNRVGYTFSPGWNTIQTPSTQTPGITYTPGSVYDNNDDLILYAQWEPIMHNVFYNFNISDGDTIDPIDINSMPNQTLVQEATTWYIDSKKPRRQNGYHNFIGWSTTTAISNETVYYQPGQKITESVTADLTLYAHWKRLKYNVYYNANGGTNTPATQENINYGVPTTVANAITKDSVVNNYSVTFITEGGTIDGSSNRKDITASNSTTYSFKNWNDKLNGKGISYESNSSYPKENGAYQNVELYAQWQVNWPDPLYPTITLPSPSSITPPENHAFNGWSQINDNNNWRIHVLDTDATEYTVTASNIVLYAEWKSLIYSIKYSEGNALGSDWKVKNLPDIQSAIPLGEKVVISNQIPVAYKEDNIHTPYKVTYVGFDKTEEVDVAYTILLQGWKKNGEGEIYYPGQECDPLTNIGDAQITLVAYWENQPVDGFKLPIPEEVTGYTFDGWYRDPSYNSNFKIGMGGELISPSEEREDITLWGKWDPIKYGIQYAGDSENNYSQWVNYGETLTITKEYKPTKSPDSTTYTANFSTNEDLNINFVVVNSYSFNNWISDKELDDGSRKIYKGGYSWNTKDIFDEYMSWDDQINSYVLRLNPQWETNLIIPDILLPEGNSNFEKWDVYLQDTEEYVGTYEGGQLFTPPAGNILIEPHQDITEYSITYDFNGGTHNGQNSLVETCNYGTICNITNIEPIKNDQLIGNFTVTIHTGKEELIETASPIYQYTFNHNWNKRIDGTGINYTSNMEYKENKDTTLYAQWDKSINMTNTSNYIPLTIPNYEGYDFEGWYADSNLTKLISTTNIDYIPTSDTDIYAKWNNARYQIQYDVNGGKSNTAPSTQTKIYNQDIVLSNKIPTYLDHIFSGWKAQTEIQRINYNELNSDSYSYKIVNNEEINYNIYYYLSNSKTEIPSINLNWSSEKPTPTEDLPYIWAYVEIIWPNIPNIPSQSNDYTIPVCINEYQNFEIVKEYFPAGSPDAVPGPQHSDWTTEKLESDDDYIFERLSICWFTLYQPKDTYSWNHNTILIAQWREIKTLTEWLSNWENTTASIQADIAGNQLTLWQGTQSITVNTDQLKIALGQLDIGNNQTENHTLGYGYKLKLNLINPYNDIDDNNNIESLSRTIFVPGKKDQNNNYYGLYKILPGVKVSEISLFDGAQASISYKAYMDLDFIDVNAPRFYEIIDQIVGQISDSWNYGQDISQLLKAKYYAQDEENNMNYEYSLDAWYNMTFDGEPNFINVLISTVDNSNLQNYKLDKNGLYTEITEIDPQTNAEIIIKNYLDSNTQINQCIILENANGAINYQANLVQRIYI